MISVRVAEPTAREQQLIRDGFQVKNRIHPELRDLYGDLLAGDVVVHVGTGWREIVVEALDRLAGMNVVVTLIREKLGGCQVMAYPREAWRDKAHMINSGDVCRQAWARSLMTREVCGEAGERSTTMPVRCRCDAHKDVI